MAEKRDYYEVLGLSKDADAEKMKKTYRQMALKYHPDRNPGDKKAEERFKEVAEAYEVLSDPAKKRRYDQVGGAGMGPGYEYAARGFEGERMADAMRIFEEVFRGSFGRGLGNILEGMFGEGLGVGGAGVRRGEDLTYEMEVSLEEAATGIERRIRLRRPEPCRTCGGSGAAPGQQLITCLACGGQGRVGYSQGVFSFTQSCDRCQGRGRIVGTPCKDCGGKGVVKETRKIAVKVPGGVDTGTLVRVAGEGIPGEGGGPPGDLFILIKQKNHEFFVRRGKELYCEVPISVAEAALGTKVVVPTLDGKVKVTIPAGTQSGHTFRVAGKGVPGLQGRRKGDMYVRVHMETPTRLNERERELLQELERIEKTKPGPLRERFLDFLKRTFGGS